MFLVLCFISTVVSFISAQGNSPIFELNGEVPPEEKDILYYLIITLFVFFTVTSTILTGIFLFSSVYFWANFKTMKFFWFLTQLTLSVFILSTLNLFINVPATLFSLITKEFVNSVFYVSMSYVIDFCHYTILMSNLVIAVQRFFVFFFRHLTYRVFDSFIIFIWLALVWSISGAVTILMAANNCKYIYKKSDKHYVLNCQPTNSVVDIRPPKWIQMMEFILQFGIPCFVFGMYVAVVMKISIMRKSSLNKNEIRILIQAIIIFLLFQASSTVFLFCQTLSFNTATAFIIKRVINSIEAEVPPKEKDLIYYLVITLFVLSIVAATLLTGAFLVLLIILWGQFKSTKYYWFLLQLTLSVFLLSTLNLVINVPATLFSLITKEFVTSEVYTILSYAVDYLHYTLLISNLVIAIQRFCVFFYRQLTYRAFDSYYIYLWLLSIWVIPGVVVYIMMHNNCKYIYQPNGGPFVLKCNTSNIIIDLPNPEIIKIIEITLQFGIPLIVFCMYIAVIIKIVSMKKASLNRHETRVLIQAVAIFILFQTSSTVFLFCQSLHFNTATAFIIKRAINTLEILAGVATPCFSFFTSKEIRKMLTTKIATISSHGSSNAVVRKPTLVEVDN